MTTAEPITINTPEVARLTGMTPRQARHLLAQLEADGLKRKGQGKGTHYLRRQFFQAYEAMDTRP